jgi:prepilin-type N-terminal cleavage/methylation domain-containing protein
MNARPSLIRPVQTRRAFSLVELLVVIVIMGIVMAFVVPAFQTINAANDLTRATTGIAGILQQARAYAMSNNLYVYVGITEVNVDVSADQVPQTPANATAGGRVAVAAVAARDGTRGYDLLSTLPDPAWTNYNNGGGFLPLNKVSTFDNVHIAASLGQGSPTGSMARNSVAGAAMIGDPACKSVTPFSWPLGSSLNANQCKFYFVKVIQFDPQGVARIQDTTSQDNIGLWMEVALQQTHGSAIPPVSANGTGAVAAIQIDSMTGAVRVYRP